MKFKQVGNVSITGVSAVIGQPVLGGTPDWILYIDNAGNLYGDNLATRDSTTNESHIGQDDGTYTSQLLVLDASGFGDWAVGVDRSENLGLNSATLAVINGNIIGSPDGAVAFGSFTDVTGNIAGTMFMQSSGILIDHDDVTSNSAQLFSSASLGARMRYNDANSANTYDNSFFVNSSGIGWADLLGGQNFFLPIVDGANGTALVTDGAGNLSFAAVSGSMTIGAPVIGGTPTEVLYIDNTGNLFSDAGFYRDSVTNDTAWTNPNIQVGYGASILMDATVSTSIVMAYVSPAVVGSTNLLRDTRNVMYWRDNPNQILAGVDIDSVGGGTPKAQIAWQNGVFSTLARLYATQLNAVMEYSQVNLNQAIMENQYFYVQSNVINPNSRYFQLDFTNMQFVMGDISNSQNGIGLIVDDTNRGVLFGDIATQNNGLVFSLDDINEAIDFGDPAGISGGVVFALRNAALGVRQIAFGSLSGTDGIRFEMDLNNRAIAMGDLTGLVNGTLLDIDDPAQSFQVRTNLTEIMAHVSGAATNPVSFGWKALQTVAGTGNSAFGNLAGQLIDTATDNTAIGNSALASNTGGVSNTAVGVGALFDLNDSGGSDAEYNQAFGRDAGSNVTTGSYNNLFGYNTGSTLTTGRDNILIGNSANVSAAGAISRVAIGFTATATADYQVMFGGTGSPFSTFVIGGGDAVGTMNSTNVLFRINNQSGSDEAGRSLTIQPGIATGNAVVGDTIIRSSIAGASGTTLQTTSVWGRFSQRRVRFGDLDGVGGNTYIDINDTAGNLYVQLSASNLIQFNTNNRIHLNGGQRVKRADVDNTNYTIQTSDYELTAINLSADRTFTVPDASTAFGGQTFIIKNDIVNTFNVICDPTGTDTIDGNTTVTLTPGQCLTITSDGGTDWEIVSLYSNAVISSGTYTPTLTNVTNVSASTAYQCQWMRVGSTVTVSGKVDIDATLGVATELGISLPIASNFGAEEDCGGVAACSSTAGLSASIRADAGNDRASLQYVAVSLTNDSYFFTFTYQVI